MLEVLAEYESDLDGERIRDGIRKSAERAMANGCVHYGWDIVDGRYVVNEGEAAVIRTGVRMLLEGESVADVVRAWEPYRTKRGAGGASRRSGSSSCAGRTAASTTTPG